MSQMIKRENITISIGSYEKDGQTKQRIKTIGEIVTMRGDDGSEYQFGDLWGATGSTKFKVRAQQDWQQQQPPKQRQQVPQQQYVQNGQPMNPQQVQQTQQQAADNSLDDGIPF